MKIERIKRIKKYLLLMVSALFLAVPFVLARNSSAFYTTKGIAIYFLEILNLLVIFWLFYLISEIDLFVQGKIGKALTFVIIGI